MTIILYAVGDIMLGEQPLTYRFGVGSVIKKKGIDYLFSYVKDIFEDGDIVMGNLEAPLSMHSNKKSYAADFFRADPQLASALKKARFNVLSVANNHIFEHGEPAFHECVTLLEKNQILPAGIKNKPVFMDINGTRIAFLAYSCIEDGFSQTPYNRITSPDTIYWEIQQVKEKADCIIVSLHWGKEYCSFPSLIQRKIARNIIDNGADVIIGTHPHVLQGFEHYKGKLLVYSLGNFILDQTFISMTQKSAIAKISLSPENNSIECTFIPISIDTQEYFPARTDNNSMSEKSGKIRTENQNNIIEDDVSKTRHYDDICRKNRNKAKYGMLMQFIKNIHRYPVTLTLWILVDAIKRRTRNARTES